MGSDASIEVLSGESPRGAVIWFHGLGADGHDFVPLVAELELACAVRFVFPHAPFRPITANGGAVMRGWYDIAEVPIAAAQAEDRIGMVAAADIAAAHISREIARGIPNEKIILAGFSQGGAVALFAGLRHPQPLAGLIALSTYLPFAAQTADERAPANQATPIFIGHGDADPIIPHAIGLASARQLTALGYAVVWQSYAMPHSLHPQEIRELAQFIARVFDGEKGGETENK